jgi:hypothetical protein
MRILLLAFCVGLAIRASGQYALTPIEATFRFAGEEKLKVATADSKLSELIVTIRGYVIPVPQAELKGLPRVYIDSVRYELPLGSDSTHREVFFKAGVRGDSFANPPVPAKVIDLVLSFDDGKFSGWMTTTPIDETTSEVWTKLPGQPAVHRASVRKMPKTRLNLESSADKTLNSDQGGAGQPATRSESKPEDVYKPQPETDGRSR